ncbi:hypothetical protein FEM48_Zijuj12G0084700 [Ziziphus jujuba var. spinosa]|uniref:DC1 domain-containing protein n=1 Tax=Ziziphus jujuba var. spinosa TaxID=714518 RepID=A0A978UC86_ZIZJJ|nr:hypothetical protein FEM48_Zijuj12G0084700 [Ziziphus jujuba var. spinosa]
MNTFSPSLKPQLLWMGRKSYAMIVGVLALALLITVCPVNLRLDYAVRQCTFKREIHKHPLTFLGSSPNCSNNFRCKVCGEIGYGFYLLCVSCKYVVHVECSLLPVTISSKRHVYEFTLTQTNSIDANSDEACCDFCEEEANLGGSVYYCESCKYSGHLGCVMSAPNPPVKFSYKDANYSSTDSLDRQEVESKNMNSNFGIQFGRSNDDALLQLKHWYKEHCKVEFGSTGCTISVSHTQNENSIDNSKFLHSGKRLEHFTHQHPLILNDEYGDENGVPCYNALLSIHLIAMDVRPAKSLESISFFSHFVPEEQISLVVWHVVSTILLPPSSVMNAVMVDFPCALLPYRVGHKCHVHLFTLKYSNVEDNSDELYYGFYEERRDPNLWIYRCEEADYPAHTKCLTAELFEYVRSNSLI